MFFGVIFGQILRVQLIVDQGFAVHFCLFAEVTERSDQKNIEF